MSQQMNQEECLQVVREAQALGLKKANLPEGSAPEPEPSPSDPINLTFGVEIETFVKYLRDEFPDDETLNLFLRWVVKQVAPAGFEFDGLGELDPDDDSLDHTLEPPSPRSWIVTDDRSVNDPIVGSMGFHPEGPYNFAAREFVSRVLKFDSLGLQEVRSVVQKLSTAVHLTVSNACGFHVHVGNELKKFSFRHVQKFVLLVLTFEHLINSVLPVDRLVSKYVPPLSKSNKNFKRMSLAQRLEAVRLCGPPVGTLAALAGERGRERFAAINLHALILHGTIEFRLWPGTSDPAEMIAYVELSMALIQHAHDITDTKLDDLIKHAWTPNFTLSHLLQLMGKEQLAEFFSLRIRSEAVRGFEPPWLHPWDKDNAPQ